MVFVPIPGSSSAPRRLPLQGEASSGLVTMVQHLLKLPGDLVGGGGQQGSSWAVRGVACSSCPAR